MSSQTSCSGNTAAKPSSHNTSVGISTSSQKRFTDNGNKAARPSASANHSV